MNRSRRLSNVFFTFLGAAAVGLVIAILSVTGVLDDLGNGDRQTIVTTPPPSHFSLSMDALNAGPGKDRAYTTFMTVMARLDRKGLLTRRREGKTDLYRPALGRDEYADLRARAEVASLVDQFGDVALGHFARQMAQLDPDRRRALQRLARER